MKRLTDLQNYTGVLPYSSELFGVYQPLIGWTSKRQKERVERGYANDLDKAGRALLARLRPEFEIKVSERAQRGEIVDLRAATLEGTRQRSTGTFIGEVIARRLPPASEYTESVWRILENDRLHEMLRSEVVPQIRDWQARAANDGVAGTGQRVTATPLELMSEQLSRESVVAGYLLHLRETKQFGALFQIFYKQDVDLSKLTAMMQFRDPLDYFDPKHEIERAGLSPIGIVHLYRQYFYEFDTFLGSPVGHVWLSPGSTVELMEVTTRRTLVERTTESSVDTVVRTESSVTEEDEISEAVKQDNRSDTKFGMNSTLNQGWIGGSATATASMNIDTTQSKAREDTHRRMRSQTEKLSTEIRKNFKSTFRTVTETTDTSSKRYVLQNSTAALVNYELRRKMRQVGVQVQDVGTYLCWQTYVDDPGRDLGIAKLIHIAKDPELGHIPPPEKIPAPGDHMTEHNIDIPFVPRTEDTEPDEDMDEAYRYGVEVNTDANEGTPEKVQYIFSGLKASCDLVNYQYDGIDFDYGGNDVIIEVEDLQEPTPGQVTYTIKLKHVNFRNNPHLRVIAKVKWRPTDAYRAEIAKKEQENVDAYTAASDREFKKAFVDAARDRVTKASKIDPRPFEELREEERIVVYRALIQDMLTRGVPMPDDRTRHVVAELLNTIFDIDKMLYFVAPEWWRPRLHRSHQVLGGEPPRPARPPAAGGGAGAGAAGGAGNAVKRSVFSDVKIAATQGLVTGIAQQLKAAANREDTTVASSNVVAWGGVGEGRADNYYITDESYPAKLGSSLGWLLQLDGDNMRNAFLNAPWVKAVIPVRPGKERAAINWLTQVQVEGADGLDNRYVAPPAELADIPSAGPAPTIREAIDHLCDKVAAKHRAARTVSAYPPEEINDDNKVLATPLDKVYEHGFYPLQGGFKFQPGDEPFEVFDQWVEIVPTDQVVPVEVAYDPKTGRMK